MATLNELREYFLKEVPAEASAEARHMITTDSRFDSYYVLSRAVKDGRLGPNITSNGIHYYCDILVGAGFLTKGADDSRRFVYYPTDKARNLIRMVSCSDVLIEQSV